MPTREAEGLERRVAAVVAALVLAYAGVFLVVASRGWFAFDDFAFLSRVRNVEPWSWFDPMAALERPFWPFYRPLGMESYYYVGLRLFGLEPIGFRALAVLVDLSTGLLVLRIARRLGFALTPAAIAAALTVTSAPRSHALFESFSFQYTSALFFYALTVSLFLEHLARRSALLWLASVAALLGGLLCNEVLVTAPVLLGLLALRAEGGFGAAALLRAGFRVVAHGLVAVAWLGLRFALLERLRPPAIYDPVLGPHVLHNLASYLSWVLGPGPLPAPANPLPIAATGLIAAGLVAAGLRSPAGRRRAREWLLPTGLVCLAWAGLVLAPVLALRMLQPRYAAPASIPLGLAFGACFDLCWGEAEARRRRWLALGGVALVLAALPYGTLLAAARRPVGEPAKKLYTLMRGELDRRPTLVRFFILHGHPTLATERQWIRFQWLIWGGEFLRAAFPERFRQGTLRLRWVDVSALGKRSAFRPQPPCVYLALHPDGSIDLAEPALLERVLPVGVARRCASWGTQSGVRPTPASRRSKTPRARRKVARTTSRFAGDP